MDWVETTGRTLEEAKDAALDQLGVDEADAEFQILEEPKPGLFGRVRGEARVRARVRPATPRPKEDRRRRRTKPAPERAERSTRRKTTKQDDASPDENAAGTDATEDVEVEDVSDIEDAGTAVTPDIEAQADQAEDFIDGLLEALGLDADIAVEVGDDAIDIAITGRDLGMLIGQKAATLSAIQELTRTAVQRHSEDRVARISVDVAGYRQKRKEALERFTRQVAEEVVSSGQERALEAMSPADRKVVHDTANTIDGVTTTSQGEEPNRRVVIRPE